MFAFWQSQIMFFVFRPILIHNVLHFFFLSVFFFTDIHNSQDSRRKGEGEAIFLTPLYHFHLLPRHIDIRWVINAESSPIPIANNQTRTQNPWFLSTRHETLSYAYLYFLLQCPLMIQPKQQVYKWWENVNVCTSNILFTPPWSAKLNDQTRYAWFLLKKESRWRQDNRFVLKSFNQRSVRSSHPNMLSKKVFLKMLQSS